MKNIQSVPSKASAAYGQACSNCVKAKCKCVLREENCCERCHRLNKHCQPATFVRKRGPPRSTRTTQLEDKLDNLVTLLQVSRQTRPVHEPTIPQAQQAPAQLPTPPPPSDPQFQSRQAALGFPGSSTGDAVSPLPSTQSHPEVLSFFRARYLEYFPFIHLPTAITGILKVREGTYKDRVVNLTRASRANVIQSVETFVQERPFTYRAIQVICEKSRERQKEYGDRVRQDLVIRVTLRGERSIDLLLCLLTCITWQIYFTSSRKGGLGMFLNVTKYVIADLGFNKPTGMIMACPKPPTTIGQVPEQSETLSAPVPVGHWIYQHETHTHEERRALLACFALCAMAALAVKAEPMKWSSSIGRACDQLALNSDDEGDKILVAIAHISRVSVEAYNTIQLILDEPSKAPQARAQIGPLRTMLEMVKSNLTPSQQLHSIVSCYLHHTEMQIYEPALYDISSSPASSLDLQRIEHLTACLHACKAAFENYFATPTITLNMVMVFAFSHACQNIYTLSVIDYPGWDRIAARATVDVLWCFEQAGTRFEEASRQVQEETGCAENIFSLAGGSEGMKHVEAKWKESLEMATGGGADFATGTLGDMWMSDPDLWFTNVFVNQA